MGNVRALVAIGMMMGCAGSTGVEGTEVSNGTAAAAGVVEAARHGHRPPACPATPPRRGKLSGCGTATIDAKMTRREWRHADSIRFDVNLPGGGTTPARLFVMNDAHNFYAALRFARTAVDPGNSFNLEFDNDHDCVRENGDDAQVMNPSIGGIVDDFRTNDPPCPPGAPVAACAPRDTDVGGSNDGDGAFANDGAVTVYEVSHPLDSGDTGHDIAVGPGDRLGMTVFVRMIGPGGVFPDDFGDTTFPDGGELSVRIRSCGHHHGDDHDGCDRDRADDDADRDAGDDLDD